jgi:hypothetical protein
MQEFSPKSAARVAGADIESLTRSDNRRRLVIDLPYDRVRTVLWAITMAVVVLGIFREGWLAVYGKDSALGELSAIDLNSENALGEWWSVLQLMLAAALLAINGRVEPNRQWKPYWFVLAPMFVFLSFDESAQVHERVMGFLPSRTGFLMFTWIIPYGVICLRNRLLLSPVRCCPAASHPPARDPGGRIVHRGRFGNGGRRRTLRHHTKCGLLAIGGHCRGGRRDDRADPVCPGIVGAAAFALPDIRRQYLAAHPSQARANFLYLMRFGSTASSPRRRFLSSS